MKDYICFICGKMFKRYPCQISNDKPTCSKTCQNEKHRREQSGINNANYKTGICCKESLCACGKKKDYRAKRCSICARKSYPHDKTSIITDDEIIGAIKISKTILEAAKTIKMNRERMSNFIKERNIDISHFNLCNFRPYTAESLLKIDTQRRNGTVKSFLKKNKLLKYQCAICDLLPEWHGEKLSLELDHINGNPKDNRLENLRFLCPNCHSQTPTFTGRAKYGYRKRK